MNETVAKMLGNTRKYLGDALIKVSDFTSEMEEYTLPLVDPETGSTEASITFFGQLISKQEAMNTRVDIAYEYQRYQTDWCDKLLPTDPGR